MTELTDEQLMKIISPELKNAVKDKGGPLAAEKAMRNVSSTLKNRLPTVPRTQTSVRMRRQTLKARQSTEDEVHMIHGKAGKEGNEGKEGKEE